MSRFFFVPVMLRSIGSKIDRRVVVDITIGVVAAIASSVIFQIYIDRSAYSLESRKFQNSLGIMRQYCNTFSTWYDPGTQSYDALQIHRMPGFPDPVVEGAINSLRVIGDFNDEAYSALMKMSQVYKRDLLNYLFNGDGVRQWRAKEYWQALDFVCAWSGVKANLFCAPNNTAMLTANGPISTYYAGSEEGEIVPCDSEAIYATYVFPEF